MNIKPFRIKAVLFDFDGTLTKPGALDFSSMKDTLECPDDISILEFIENFPEPEQREKAFARLEHFEQEAAGKSQPNTDAEELIHYLHAKGLMTGIITRNSLKSVECALQNFGNLGMSDFDLVISRDDAFPPKPAPDGILMAAEKLNADVREMLMVGDFIFDILAGQNAGAITVLLSNGSIDKPRATWEKLGYKNCESDYTISGLGELRDIVRMGMPLPAGKFPNEMLKETLEQFSFSDPSVLIPPGIGQDTAAVDIGGEEVLILKSDPITFATDSAAHYAVLVNANDIATSGAEPRWFLTTLLFPCGTTPSEIHHTVCELKEVSSQWGITLCGGHTEITEAVTRPVITGMMAGTLSRENLIDKQNMRRGDKVLLTKAIAVEGTSIIAREFGEQLRVFGMQEEEIRQCRDFLSHISILREAGIAARSPGTSAMHDVTEGGLATAVEELGIAGGHKIRISMNAVPVFPQTREICRLLDIHPMGLIGSGSLLICCRENEYEKLIARIREAGISVSCIGEVLDEGQGIEALQEGQQAEWPQFEVDEIARLF